MEKLRNLAKSTPITLESWLLSFVSIVLLRTFFEQFSNADKMRYALIDLPTIVHYGVFYLSISLIVMCILVHIENIDMKEASLVTLFGFNIILLPPLIDIMTAGPGGHIMTYLFIPKNELMLRFFTFFNGYITQGITPGIQLEIVLIIFFLYAYIKYVTKSNKKAVIACVIFYTCIFILLSMPSLLAQSKQELFGSIISSHILKNNIHPQFQGIDTAILDLGFNKLMSGIFTLITIGGTLLFFFIGAKEKLYETLKNSRPERFIHYILLFILGWSLTGVRLSNWIDVMEIVLSCMAITSAWIFSVCQNDIHDEHIDVISNKHRPLILKKISRTDMEFISHVSLLIAILSAYSISHYMLFFILAFICIYHIYSTPPLRLKRFLGINSLCIGLACINIMLSGFFLMYPDKNILSFPFELLITLLIVFSLASNMKDIKDREGDAVEKIHTLPVLLGDQKSKLIISTIISLCYILAPFYFSTTLLIIPSILAAIFSWKYINANPYIERKFFIVWILYLTTLIVTMFWIY